ncbi:short-chain fatty acyl-CoA regulator family protein [Roseateles cellulosilyticus]|uniref:Short-chain fatty acyl-CoA regulator family protein n=1 Tax=Pelomonas cellulosilytica TaxID=2906762 RepID=A0ABS8XMQ0_9BURK|nr:short-chain fatty acyl-CoA regulator family protein [Pelomonas sp. P8]MCE4552907.1 short-chain fatty acyl-CoA regulator family protein [Pelomonas sp. P8]
MRKTFFGVKLRVLREQNGMTQAGLARVLQLSPSYVNQLENNERPLSVQVLLRLQSALGVDLQFFSEDVEALQLAQLREVAAESTQLGGVPQAELLALAQQMPAASQLLLGLHRRAVYAEQRLAHLGVAGPEPQDEVRDFFQARQNHIDELDRAAERLSARLGSTDSAALLAPQLEAHLLGVHQVQVRTLPGEAARRFEPEQRLLFLPDALGPGQHAFQLATQLAALEAGGMIDRLVASGGFSAEAARLAGTGLASYFAGALLLPYGRFLAAAQQLRHDVVLLARRFGVSVETVCHRLSTLQRREARGVPFVFVRVDRAGHISKRQSATSFTFPRCGGSCPLWNVYDAFAQPGRVVTQIAQMPDGRRYLWFAHCEPRTTGGHGSPMRQFSIGLGCELRHATQLVYSQGLDLGDAAPATPIGPGCRSCAREGCPQRAFPVPGRRVDVHEHVAPHRALG